MSRRTVVRLAPDGRLYAAPRTPLPTRPRYAAPEPDGQAVSDPVTGAESDRKSSRGSRPGRHALDADEVRAIRADYSAGKWSMNELAYIYSVSQPTIFAAIRGYFHVPRED